MESQPDVLWKVSLKILISGLILKTLTHELCVVFMLLVLCLCIMKIVCRIL